MGRRFDAQMKRSGERVRSPCVRNCCLGEDDVCLGCFRHLEEIKLWGLADDKARIKIVRAARRRMKNRRSTEKCIDDEVP